MRGWTKWAIAIAITTLAMGLNTGGLNFAGDLSMPGVPTGALNKFSSALSATNELSQHLSDLSGNVTGSLFVL
jgi:hypothetical protein